MTSAEGLELGLGRRTARHRSCASSPERGDGEPGHHRGREQDDRPDDEGTRVAVGEGGRRSSRGRGGPRVPPRPYEFNIVMTFANLIAGRYRFGPWYAPPLTVDRLLAQVVFVSL